MSTHILLDGSGRSIKTRILNQIPQSLYIYNQVRPEEQAPRHLYCLHQSPNDWFSVVWPNFRVSATSAKVFWIKSKKYKIRQAVFTQLVGGHRKFVAWITIDHSIIHSCYWVRAHLALAYKRMHNYSEIALMSIPTWNYSDCTFLVLYMNDYLKYTSVFFKPRLSLWPPWHLCARSILN